MTRALALGLSLSLPLACGTPAQPAPPPAPAPAPGAAAEADAAAVLIVESDAGRDTPAPLVPPASELLRDGFESRHAERVLPRARKPRSPARAVVAKDTGRSRYVFDDERLRVLVWAGDAALFETPLAVTPLTRLPAKPGAKERVLVAPGAFLEIKAEKNGLVKVAANDEDFATEGWLPKASLGRVYAPAALPEVQGIETWVLDGAAWVLEKPGGARLGKLLDGAGPQIRVQSLTQGGAWMVEIAYRSDSLLVKGFVPKSALSQPYPVGWGSGYGRLGRKNPPEEKLTFPTGACLYAEPWGEVVGVLRRPYTETVHIESGERAAWRQIAPQWTGTEVWLPREGASPTPLEEPKAPLSLAEGFSCVPAPKR